MNFTILWQEGSHSSTKDGRVNYEVFTCRQELFGSSILKEYNQDKMILSSFISYKRNSLQTAHDS
jgi:hypothetical protein